MMRVSEAWISRRASAVAALMLGLLIVASLESDGWSQTQITELPNPSQGAAFGWSAAATPKNLLLLGAPFSHAAAAAGGGAWSGAVLLFDAGGQLVRTMTRGSAAQMLDQFGLAVAPMGSNTLTGANALIGAPGVGAKQGAAYLMNTASGAEILALGRPGGRREGDAFGYAVSAVGDHAIVGAPGVWATADTGSEAGAVYVFPPGGGSPVEIRNPQPANVAAQDRFGHAVAGYGPNEIAVGAPYDGGPAAGSVRLYDLSGAAIGAPIQGTGGFGWAIASVDAGTILVGAPRYTAPPPLTGGLPPPDSGAALLVEVPSGQVLHRFENPNPSPYARFGSAVAAAGNFLLIGAPGEGNQTYAGAAYLYDLSSRQLLKRYEEPTPNSTTVANPNAFGGAVGLFATSSRVVWTGRTRVLVGAPTVDAGVTNSGAAYVYRYCHLLVSCLDQSILELLERGAFHQGVVDRAK